MPVPHSLSVRAPKVLRGVTVFARARLPSRHGEFEIVSFIDEGGRTLDDVAIVVNCHLHFDHCGGNRLLPHRPVFAQRAEHAAALEEGYTNPALLDYDGVHYELLEGETEILPGAHLIPTPGHTTGHQSLALRCDDGTVVLAGQSHDHASGFTADELARRAQLAGLPQPLPDYPGWLDRLMDLDPRRVLFAHDLAVWEPSG